MDDCIFCKIVAKQIPSKTFYEDDDVVAFHDIRPHAPMHFLIVPKQHIATLADCGPEQQALLGKMLLLASKLAAELGCAYVPSKEGTAGSGGFKTQFNIGPAGGQEVYHLHLHVLGHPQA